jgi:hypothetical protein
MLKTVWVVVRCLVWVGRDTTAEDFNGSAAMTFRRKNNTGSVDFVLSGSFLFYSFAGLLQTVVEKKYLFCFFSRYFYYFQKKESYNLKISIPASLANCSTIGLLL